MLHLDSGECGGGHPRAIRVRESVCLRRTGGAWRITHEHVSIPIDPATMRIWLPSDKDQPA